MKEHYSKEHLNQNIHENWEDILKSLWREILKLPNDFALNNDSSFIDLGGDSLSASFLIITLNERYHLSIQPDSLLDHQTLGSQVEYLFKITREPSKQIIQSAIEQNKISTQDPIAIIGISGSFPGAENCINFWNNLLAGYVSYNNDNIYQFPAESLGFSDTEALLLDPQQRIFLYRAWQLLKQTGYLGKEHDIGVIGAASPSRYLSMALLEHPDLLKKYNSLELCIANDLGSLASRVSYKFNLTGPAIALDTFCSSSFVAIDLACQLLHNNRCKMAIVGAVSAITYEPNGVIFSKSKRCLPFSSKTDGTLFTSSCGLLLLKPLSEAIKDGDEIIATIKAALSNQDGSAKSGFCAPSFQAQEVLYKQCLKEAGLQTKDISYIEAHGSCTLLSDKLELNTIDKVFSDIQPKSLAVGSVKGNIGHSERAAGIVGLIKALYICRTGLIPPTITEEPLPILSDPKSRIRINLETESISRNTNINILVSNLGFGGTNSLIIISNYYNNFSKNSILFKEPPVLNSNHYSIIGKIVQNNDEHCIKDESTNSSTNLLIEEYLLKILQEESGHEDICLETDMFSLGLDSLSVYMLISNIEKSYHLSIKPDILFSCKTVKDLLNSINNTKPRGNLDELLLIIYKETTGIELDNINHIIDKFTDEFWNILYEIFEIKLDKTIFGQNAITIATISNYISSQISPTKIEEKCSIFIKAYNK